MSLWVPRDGLLASGRPSFERVVSGTQPMRKETPKRSAWPASTTWSFPADHALTHNEHPRAGYRTLCFAPRPIVLLGRRVIASPVTRSDALGRSGRPKCAKPSLVAPPLFSVWQPQRAVKGRVARLVFGRPPGLSPLTARFAAALPRASRSEPPGLVDITNRSLHYVWTN